ncbi:type III polyketide synthase [Microbacterium sp. NPDC076911]|uniref:type III polyketide synthase n=1 Tax=Microbacterium sp. NPDC076911 TaxID=3154958 RepID=UPI0034276075
MTARILSLATAVPPTRVAQTRIRDFLTSQPGTDRLSQRLIHASFDAAAIDYRHTVLTQLGDATAEPAGGGSAHRGPDFVVDEQLLIPSTGTRNDVYTAVAPDLSARAAAHAIAEAHVNAEDITHVVTVSCTGFFAPGPDYRLVRDLGLAATVERYHLGFIGCAAAIPALRLAARITSAQPDAVVLVVCAELCTLHVRASNDPQQIVAASVFADGAGAAIVSARAELGRHGGLDMERFATTLTGQGESDMVWTIGDAGFEMTLSAEVPRIIGREIRGAVDAFLGVDAQPDAWAVHPGGRSVLDRVETGLDLAPRAIDSSRAVLRQYGNMSSATLLFILREMLHNEELGDGDSVCALAFGPGLTVESALLTKRSATA